MSSQWLIVAHRGSALLWPENTIHAFRSAADFGAELIEFDLHATADGVLVVLHDRTLDRITQGSGPVAALTLDELRGLDAAYRWSPDGSSFPERGGGHTVPTLAEVFSALPELRFNLEIKQDAPSIAPTLCAIVREFGMQHRVLVASFHAAAVREFRRACPEVATSATEPEARRFLVAHLLPGTPYTPPRQALQLPEQLGRLPVLTRRLVEAAHARNPEVHAFTTNERTTCAASSGSASMASSPTGRTCCASCGAL